jgi:hypothetical protein
MIFWRSQPSFYTRFLTPEETGWAADVFNLLKTIIDNFEKNFYKNENIFYDPTCDLSAEDPDYKDPKAKWDIPEFMKEPAKGEDIFF